MLKTYNEKITIRQDTTIKKLQTDLVAYQKELNNEKQLIKEIEKLRAQISLMPGGELYLQAQEEFTLNKSKC